MHGPILSVRGGGDAQRLPHSPEKKEKGSVGLHPQLAARDKKKMLHPPPCINSADVCKSHVKGYAEDSTSSCH